MYQEEHLHQILQSVHLASAGLKAYYALVCLLLLADKLFIAHQQLFTEALRNTVHIGPSIQECRVVTSQQRLVALNQENSQISMRKTDATWLQCLLKPKVVLSLLQHSIGIVPSTTIN